MSRETLERSDGERTRAFERTAWELFGTGTGSDTRCRLVAELEANGPLNANQLASALECDYTTVRHHLERLSETGFVVTDGPERGYDVRYRLGDALARNWPWVDTQWLESTSR
ncbi:winged helix-turn-helix domain-containing protein [Natronobiforma cellulositropha]|uniref:winged helix-turn-helix domain-containing protein n=1 Tax=Natronobiforma cellulositropha TaxID=1679076 RepID=UPI0021D5D358|nr:winged helix-turn-helix domain-containing protein [Natronobiforma cellulositropha]